MGHHRNILLLLLLLATLATLMQPKDVYISTTAGDDNAVAFHQRASPLRTAQRAVNLAADGDRLLFIGDVVNGSTFGSEGELCVQNLLGGAGSFEGAAGLDWDTSARASIATDLPHIGSKSLRLQLSRRLVFQVEEQLRATASFGPDFIRPNLRYRMRAWARAVETREDGDPVGGTCADIVLQTPLRTSILAALAVKCNAQLGWQLLEVWVTMPSSYPDGVSWPANITASATSASANVTIYVDDLSLVPFPATDVTALFDHSNSGLRGEYVQGFVFPG